MLQGSDPPSNNFSNLFFLGKKDALFAYELSKNPIWARDDAFFVFKLIGYSISISVEGRTAAYKQILLQFCSRMLLALTNCFIES